MVTSCCAVEVEEEGKRMYAASLEDDKLDFQSGNEEAMNGAPRLNTVDGD